MPRIGFVLLTHLEPAQTLRLCARLNVMFDTPPIAIHHDFGKTELSKAAFPSNVRFVDPWISTRWGRFSIVDATLRAIRLLYTFSDPDWFVVLSASDYPVARAETVLHELSTSRVDAFLDHRAVHYPPIPRPPDYGKFCYDHPSWVREPYDRYMALGLGFFKLAVRFKWKRQAFYIRWHRLIPLLTPFRHGIRCFAGDFWMTANRRCAEILIGDNALTSDMLAHFRKRPIPDEGFFHSVLANTPGLRLSTDNKRYSDWSGTVGHPRVLGEDDLPEVLASGDHFARKFPLDLDLLNRIDALVDALPLIDSPHEKQSA